LAAGVSRSEHGVHGDQPRGSQTLARDSSQLATEGRAGAAQRTTITFEKLAEEFGVSRERVRQIEVRAFEKVQKVVRHRVAAMERPEAPAAL